MRETIAINKGLKRLAVDRCAPRIGGNALRIGAAQHEKIAFAGDSLFEKIFYFFGELASDREGRRLGESQFGLIAHDVFETTRREFDEHALRIGKHIRGVRCAVDERDFPKDTSRSQRSERTLLAFDQYQ